MVYIENGRGESIKCRALLDTCATANFISKRIVNQLNLSMKKRTTSIGTISSVGTESKGIVEISMRSIYGEFSRELTCLVIPTISDLIPSTVISRDTINIPPNIRLADPEFHLPREISLLIGSGATLALFAIGQINLSKTGHDLYLQKTHLGWVIASAITPVTKSERVECHMTQFEKLIERFWTIENGEDTAGRTGGENECEQHFVRTVVRDASGRYIVSLPFKQTDKRLGDSRNMALKRLVALEHKFQTNAKLSGEYHRVIENYCERGYLSIVDDVEDGYYMPHHAVFKDSSNTTKIRVVFDASAKTSTGVSLNDLLLTGSTIQDKLFSHLIRFRAYQYVLTADIEKMYLQILLNERDRRYQRILWREDGTIRTLQFNTLTFGVASSPFLATRVLQKLADDEREAFPRAAEIIKNHLYVDDLLTGADSVEQAREIRNEIIELLKRGGLTIRQWAANDERIVNDLDINAMHACFALNKDYSLTTLGVTWMARKDKIKYNVQKIKIATRITKRTLLAEIAKIYDPLGLLGPVMLYAKKLMQDVWRRQLKWDESVPQDIHSAWTTFVQQLDLINQVAFERRVLYGNTDDIQIHGFCDASNVGYGACIYVRSGAIEHSADDKTCIRLLCAKSRVAPIKPLTVPRLELCGALLLARLYNEIRRTLISMRPIKVTFWCDSTVVLHWVKMSAQSLNVFVSNRVTEIQKYTNPDDWRHVRTADNPVDALSRGQFPQALLRNEMVHGAEMAG